MRATTGKRLIIIACSTAAAICAVLWGASEFVDYSTSLAVVGGGGAPGFATTDIAALEAISHPTEFTPGVPELRSTGRVLAVAEGTECRVMEENTRISCQGRHFAARVKLLDGPRRNQLVWMCSDSFVKQYKWP